MANNHQPTVSDPDTNMGDSPPSSPRLRTPHPAMSQMPPAQAGPHPIPSPPQGDQGQGLPRLPPFSHLPPPVSRESPYIPSPQWLQPTSRMVPPGHNPHAAQSQPGGAHLQGHGHIHAPSAPSYHNALASHVVHDDDIPWAPGHGEVRDYRAPPADEQASQPPRAASSYPTAPGNPTGVGPQHTGAHQPPVSHLPQFPGVPRIPHHVYPPQQPFPGVHAPGSGPVDTNGNTSYEPGCDTSTGCITSYNLINCRGCITSGNCVGCDGCIACNGCTDCYGCVHCVNCTRCQGCVDCVDCVGLKGAVGQRGLRM